MALKRSMIFMQSVHKLVIILDVNVTPACLHPRSPPRAKQCSVSSLCAHCSDFNHQKDVWNNCLLKMSVLQMLLHVESFVFIGFVIFFFFYMLNIFICKCDSGNHEVLGPWGLRARTWPVTQKILDLEKWRFPWNSLPATLHCSAVTTPRALGVSVTLSRADEMQLSFLRTITVFYV